MYCDKCGKNINPVKGHIGQSSNIGEVFYFCSKICQQEFKKNYPDLFIF